MYLFKLDVFTLGRIHANGNLFILLKLQIGCIIEQFGQVSGDNSWVVSI